MLKQLLSMIGAAVLVADSTALKLSCAVPAKAFPQVNAAAPSANCRLGENYADGCPGALSAGFTNASLRAGEPHFPPWNVAGVDYSVGYATAPTGDPTTYAWTGGLSWDATNKRVIAGGSGAMTISGFDFSTHGGTWVEHSGTGALTITLSKFQAGANCKLPMILQDNGAGPITITYNDLDGGSVVGGACPINGEMIELEGGHTQTVEWNLVQNAPQHFITSGGTSGITGQLVDEFNYFTRCGFAQGEHCNGVQTIGGAYAGDVIEFNTYVNPQPDTALSASSIALPTGTFTNGSPTITAVAGLGTSSLAAGMTVVPRSPCATTPINISAGGAGSVNPNITLAGNYGGTTNTCSFDVSNAYPFGMVLPVNYTPALGGTLNGGTVGNNTIISTGPISVVSIAINCEGALSPNTPNNTNTTISTNYIDLTGVLSGPFRTTGDYCSPANTGQFGTTTYSGNVNMQTGATFGPPP